MVSLGKKSLVDSPYRASLTSEPTAVPYLIICFESIYSRFSSRRQFASLTILTANSKLFSLITFSFTRPPQILLILNIF